MRRWLLHGGVTLGVLALVALVVVVAGLVPTKASSGHWAVTRWLLELAMERSVATRSAGVRAPPLADPALALKGAGHYERGCRPCHGAPGSRRPRIPAAMTPPPPDLVESVPEWDDAELFTLVMHGVKFTGMPAWPAQQREDEAWAVVAFLRSTLPLLDAREYEALVAPAHEPGAPPVVAERCAPCHGARGLGRQGAFPRLAGQSERYLAASLRAYADGARHSGIMEPIAAELDDAELAEAAAWYARQPAGAPIVGEEDLAARGAQLARHGLQERGIPACAPCHGPSQHPRNAAFPRLTAQDPAYLTLQLELFVEGRRGGSEWSALMQPVVTHDLRLDEIRAVAAYYAGLEVER